MSNRKTVSRRKLLGGVAASAGALVAAKTVSAACSITPYQVNGPFFPVAINDYDWDMTQVPGRRNRAEGQVVEITGRILNANCLPERGALIDIWQANAAGRYLHPRDPNPAPLDPNFEGYARLYTAEDGVYRLRTIIPGAYPVGPNWIRPPHIHFKVHPATAPSITTQMYFAGNELNDKDGLYMSVPEEARSLITIDFSNKTADGIPQGTFDLHVDVGPELPI